MSSSLNNFSETPLGAILTAADLLSPEIYQRERPALRAQVMALKKKRRLFVGPVATVLFENRQTVWYQIQEMLYIERSAQPDPQDEIDAYNLLLPQGHDLVVTLMFSVENPEKRLAFLKSISHVENSIFMQWGGEKFYAQPIDHEERTRDDGKTSAVHFLRFDFSSLKSFSKSENATQETPFFSITHPHYHHMVALPLEMWDEVRQDLIVKF